MKDQDYNLKRYDNGKIVYRNNKSFDQMNQIFRNGQNQQSQMYNQNINNYNNMDTENFSSSPPQEKKLRWKNIFLPIIIVIILIFFCFTGYTVFKSFKQKNRTIMIYMVGSDLESQSKQGSFSINDIVGEKIDLENNNVILIVGGAKKWHNFVNTDELGIYELTTKGFKKKKSYEVKSMGNSEVLSDFLNYVYKNYPSKNFDLIFWNHGLGSLGIEQDELSEDYLSIQELNNGFLNSKFKNRKLELVIFYNCLSGNLHIAKVMSNYANYMVASEEIMYLSKLLNRFQFLENINVKDTGYDIGMKFIEQSDTVVKEYNDTHPKKIDSTLSIIDLNEIKNLDNALNNFIKDINISSNFYSLAKIRKQLHTFGNDQASNYDTVDLYELAIELSKYSNNKDNYSTLLESINKSILYTSNLNSYSNGISIYFPYYGSSSIIESHLNTFDEIWNDDYISFIHNFYEIRNRVRRDGINDKYELENIPVINKDKVVIELDDVVKDNYQNAYIYFFKKLDNNNFELLLKSNNIYLENNKLVFKDFKVLNANGNNISLDQSTGYKAYGSVYDEEDMLDLIFSLNTYDELKIDEGVLNSKEYPNSGLIELDDYDNISLYKLKYELYDDNKINSDWKDSEEREGIIFDSNNLELKREKYDGDYYVLIEIHDENNNIYYSKLIKNS